MTTMILKALDFAKAKHSGQVRRGSGAPYVTHPIAVSYLVASYKRSKHLNELLVAALLHDTLEDTDTNFVELASTFSPLVASLVLELTSDEKEISKVGKNEYLKKELLGISSYGLVLKLADRLHNVTDSPKPAYVKDTIELMAYIQENRKLSKTHQAIVADILEKCGEQLA